MAKVYARMVRNGKMTLENVPVCLLACIGIARFIHAGGAWDD